MEILFVVAAELVRGCELNWSWFDDNDMNNLIVGSAGKWWFI